LKHSPKRMPRISSGQASASGPSFGISNDCKSGSCVS
jgi:hypothetical protein